MELGRMDAQAWRKGRMECSVSIKGLCSQGLFRTPEGRSVNLEGVRGKVLREGTGNVSISLKPWDLCEGICILSQGH